jgi:ubiquinol-cytochrome c reductase iron-sulfur subunit
VSEHGGYEAPDVDELHEMDPEQLMTVGAEVDGVHIKHRRDRFPVRGTKGEKRAERAVAGSFALAGAAGVGFIIAFSTMKWQWHLPGTPQTFRYYNITLGVLLAIMLLAMGVGLVLWAKLLMPEEEVVQDRHQEESSSQEDILMTEGTLLSGLDDTGLPRRSLILRSLGLAGGAMAAVPLVAIVGAMVKDPGKQLVVTLFARNKKLFPKTGGRVPLVYDDWRRVSPNDLKPGGIATVFPGVHKDVDGVNGVTSSSSPTLLIRLRPDEKVHARKGQADFGWPAHKPEYLAFSKICTHAGCPASLYEQQSNILLCPCHQSQFDVLKDAKPVFGPATRSLPKLPLDVIVDSEGGQYFVARSDYVEPIGPGFWNRK